MARSLMSFLIKCPECSHKIRVTSKDESSWPTVCDACGHDTSLPDDDVIAMPALGSLKTRLTDMGYRDMERASETRMHMAAEMAGVPASEMADLKITNLKDNCRPGDIQAVDTTAGNLRNLGVADAGTLFKSNGSEFAAGISTGNVTVNDRVTSGIFPRAGMQAQSA